MSRTNKAPEVSSKEEKKFYKGKIKSQRKEIERLQKKIESLKKQLEEKNVDKPKKKKEKKVVENNKRSEFLAKLKAEYCIKREVKDEDDN